MELPRALAATQLVGAFGLAEADALSGRIEESFLRRLEALSEETRLLLLVAAAEPVDDPLLVWRAAERLGIGISAATAEDTEGLLAIGERVSFLHPLVRSAVYRPWYKRAFWLFVANAMFLGWLGSRPAEGWYVVGMQVSSLYYFAFFIVVMPLLGLIETPRRLPNPNQCRRYLHKRRRPCDSSCGREQPKACCARVGLLRRSSSSIRRVRRPSRLG